MYGFEENILKTSEKALFWNLHQITIDCYVDSDLNGLWNQEDNNGENRDLIRTGYVLCISSCPVFWLLTCQME